MPVPAGWLPAGYAACDPSCTAPQRAQQPNGQKKIRCPCTGACAAPCDCMLVKRTQVPDNDPEAPRPWKWGPAIVVQEVCNRWALELPRTRYRCYCLKKLAGGQKRVAKYSGYYEFFKDRAGEFRFLLKSRNGEIILASEGYTTLSSCMGGVLSVMRNGPNDARYQRSETRGGKYRFNLRAGNHKVIGTSESYEAKRGRENGIRAVMKASTSLDYRTDALEQF